MGGGVGEDAAAMSITLKGRRRRSERDFFFKGSLRGVS